MGKHLSPSNEVEVDDLEQQELELVGVLVRSWSMNCPICITSTVWMSSATFESAVILWLSWRAEGSSTLPDLDFLGRWMVPSAYSGSRMRW